MADDPQQQAILFAEAFDAIRAGDFEAMYKSMTALGFTFKQTGDPNHFLYFHSKLKDDRHFSYPRNLFRPHGSHRDSRVGNRDKSKAKQSVEALKAVTRFLKEKGHEDE